MRCAVAVRYSVAPAPTGSSTTGICRAVAAPPASSIASTQWPDSVPMLSTSDDAMPRHLLDLFARVRHHRQRAERERRVRRLVHDDVVRDLVDERLLLAHRAQRRSGASSSCSHPQDVDGAVSGADLGESLRDGARRGSGSARARRRRGSRRARAARRASPSACSRLRALLRCRAARRESRCASLPSKRWSTASSPCPPVTITAGAPSSCSRSASSRRERVEPGERPRLVEVRRHDGRERKELADERVDGVVLEQLRAGARDHDRVDDERHGMLAEVRGDRLDQRRARRASPSSPRRRRCRRRPRRAARARTPAAARGSRSRRRCSARSARRARTFRARRRRRTPSGRPGCRLRRPSRTSRS